MKVVLKEFVVNVRYLTLETWTALAGSQGCASLIASLPGLELVPVSPLLPGVSSLAHLCYDAGLWEMFLEVDAPGDPC